MSEQGERVSTAAGIKFWTENCCVELWRRKVVTPLPEFLLSYLPTHSGQTLPIVSIMNIHDILYLTQPAKYLYIPLMISDCLSDLTCSLSLNDILIHLLDISIFISSSHPATADKFLSLFIRSLPPRNTSRPPPWPVDMPSCCCYSQTGVECLEDLLITPPRPGQSHWLSSLNIPMCSEVTGGVEE